MAKTIQKYKYNKYNKTSKQTKTSYIKQDFFCAHKLFFNFDLRCYYLK